MALDKKQFGAMKMRDKKSFVGIVGRQSKKVSGKQGIHHHPQMSQLGEGLANGLAVKRGPYTPPSPPALGTPFGSKTKV